MIIFQTYRSKFIGFNLQLIHQNEPRNVDVRVLGSLVKTLGNYEQKGLETFFELQKLSSQVLALLTHEFQGQEQWSQKPHLA